MCDMGVEGDARVHSDVRVEDDVGLRVIWG